jgi:hypothetical protein
MQLNENVFTWLCFAFEYQRLLEKEYTEFASIKYPKAVVTTNVFFLTTFHSANSAESAVAVYLQ